MSRLFPAPASDHDAKRILRRVPRAQDQCAGEETAVSFRSEFIDSIATELDKLTRLEEIAAATGNPVATNLLGAVDINTVSLNKLLVRRALESVIIRISTPQVKVFLDLPLFDGDARWMKLPFPSIWFDFDDPISFHYGATCDDVRAILISDELVMPRKLENEIIFGALDGCLDYEYVHKIESGISLGLFDRGISVRFIGVNSCMYSTLRIRTDGVMERPSASITDPDQQAIRLAGERMETFAIHIINFLSSPSVKLMRAEASEALQKARLRRGKQPLPGWYEITYRHHIRESLRDKSVAETSYHHSFRYDVRGHFMRFTKGRMAGRVIWCPPHQRGLANSLYKPKGYRVTSDV